MKNRSASILPLISACAFLVYSCSKSLDAPSKDKGTSSVISVALVEASSSNVSAGENHTCAVLSTGQVACWGYNGFGQLGDGSTTDKWAPVTISGITNAKQISAGKAHTCAVLSTGCHRQYETVEIVHGFAEKVTRGIGIG